MLSTHRYRLLTLAILMAMPGFASTHVLTLKTQSDVDQYFAQYNGIHIETKDVSTSKQGNVINIGERNSSSKDVPNIKYSNGVAGVYVAAGNTDGQILKHNTLNFYSGKTNLLYSAFGFSEADNNRINFYDGFADVAHVALGANENLKVTNAQFFGYGGTVQKQILAVFLRPYTHGSTASNNIVHISGMTVGQQRSNTSKTNTDVAVTIPVLGNASIAVAAVGSNAKIVAHDNLVEIVNSEIFKDVAGASVPQGGAYNNVIKISKSTVDGDVYGAIFGEVGSKNNDVLLNSAHVKGNVIGAAYLDSSDSKWKIARDDNMLTLSGASFVNTAVGFDEMTFNVTSQNADNAILTVAGGLDLTGVNVNISGDDSLTSGTSYALVQVSNDQKKIVLEDTTFTASGTFIEKKTTVHDRVELSSLATDTTSVFGSDGLTVSMSTEETENAKTLSETFLGSIAFINQGAEFIADQGIAAMNAAAEPGKFTTFGAIHGGTSQYDTGSRVDLDGGSLVVGSASRIDNLMVAGYVEAGWASSEGHVNDAKGEGDHTFYGIGVSTRYALNGPVYFDSSVRLGWANTEFDGQYRNATAHYEADSFYGTLHVGSGYVVPISSNIDLDIYGRYILTYLQGDDVALGTKQHEKFEMDDTMSHALRVGARLNGSFSTQTFWRVGLAYEHVADGDAESKVNGLGTSVSLDVPTVAGNTGIVQLGLHYAPVEISGLGFDFDLKGYAGDREGVSGSASVTYSF